MTLQWQWQSRNTYKQWSKVTSQSSEKAERKHYLILKDGQYYCLLIHHNQVSSIFKPKSEVFAANLFLNINIFTVYRESSRDANTLLTTMDGPIIQSFFHFEYDADTLVWGFFQYQVTDQVLVLNEPIIYPLKSSLSVPLSPNIAGLAIVS